MRVRAIIDSRVGEGRRREAMYGSIYVALDNSEHSDAAQVAALLEFVA